MVWSGRVWSGRSPFVAGCGSWNCTPWPRSLQCLAKVGQLLLDEGRWDGVQVVSSSWIAASTAPRGHLGDSEYGYLWWRNTLRVSGAPFEGIFARGNGGQYLFVFPAVRMVALFMGSHYNSPIGDQAVEMCARFLLTAAGAKEGSNG
jgi:CubicO group peptidase (beta-lactamase class C family)